MKKYTRILSFLSVTVMLFSCLTLYAFADVNTCAHQYKSQTVPPTCVEQGYTLYVCGKCGDYYKGDFVNALGHTYNEDEPVVDIPATCTEQGIKEWECLRCKSHKTVTYSVLTHTDGDKNGYCDYCNYEMGRKTVFSPYDWLKAFFAFITQWFQGIFA